MKFLADENVPLNTIEALKEKEIDIVSIRTSAKGLRDEDVLNIAYQQDRILITFDKDFGELAFRVRAKSKGIILLRFIPISPQDLSKRIETLINTGIPFENHFTVVTEDTIRVIPLKSLNT